MAGLHRHVRVLRGNQEPQLQVPQCRCQVGLVKEPDDVGQVGPTVGSRRVPGSGRVHLGELVKGGHHQIVDEGTLGDDEAAPQHAAPSRRASPTRHPG